MPKGRVENLRTPNTDEAREMQRKSAKKRSENIKEKKIIQERLKERLGMSDFDEIIDNLIERAKKDSRDFEVFQAALGQKPKEEIDLNGGVVIVDDITTSH